MCWHPILMDDEYRCESLPLAMILALRDKGNGGYNDHTHDTPCKDSWFSQHSFPNSIGWYFSVRGIGKILVPILSLLLRDFPFGFSSYPFYSPNFMDWDGFPCLFVERIEFA